MMSDRSGFGRRTGDGRNLRDPSSASVPRARDVLIGEQFAIAPEMEHRRRPLRSNATALHRRGQDADRNGDCGDWSSDVGIGGSRRLTRWILPTARPTAAIFKRRFIDHYGSATGVADPSTDRLNSTRPSEDVETRPSVSAALRGVPVLGRESLSSQSSARRPRYRAVDNGRGASSDRCRRDCPCRGATRWLRIAIRLPSTTNDRSGPSHHARRAPGSTTRRSGGWDPRLRLVCKRIEVRTDARRRRSAGADRRTFGNALRVQFSQRDDRSTGRCDERQRPRPRRRAVAGPHRGRPSVAVDRRGRCEQRLRSHRYDRRLHAAPRS